MYKAKTQVGKRRANRFEEEQVVRIFIHAEHIYLEHARNIHKPRGVPCECYARKYRSVYAWELLNNIRVQLVASHPAEKK